MKRRVRRKEEQREPREVGRGVRCPAEYGLRASLLNHQADREFPLQKRSIKAAPAYFIRLFR
jgi:hypothetical protein